MVGGVVLKMDPLGRSESMPGDATMTALLAEVADVLARETALRRENEALRATLERAEAAADEAKRVKAAFVAHMSHEIRTPLNAIVGLVEQLLAGPLSAEQRELASHVRASGEQMAQMLGGILDLAQIESNALALVRQRFALVEEVERALEAVAPFAAARGVELCMVASEAAYVTVMGDAGRLRQVVFNVVGNAVKFGGVGDVEVRVAVARAGEDVVAHFEVRDHGPGIDPEVLPRLFAGALGVGLGVGMKLCERVCALMGGGIAAENLPEGGALIRFHVRLGAVESPAREAVDLQGRRVRVAVGSAGLRAVVATWLVRWNARVVEQGGELVIADGDRPESRAAGDVPVVVLGPVGAVVSPGPPVVACVARPVCHDRLGAAVRTALARPSAAGAGTAPVAPERAPGELRILVAEDNPFNQRVIVGALRRLGYAADVVVDGRAAVAAVADRAYDLVLMDLMMPVLDGLAATREICARWQADERPRIVAITAQATADDHAACLAAGMVDFLTKPFETSRLAAVLQGCPRRLA